MSGRPKSPIPIRRHTLIMAEADLAFLKDMVHTKRLAGQTDFTQKEALAEIIAFYRQQNPVVKRPKPPL